MVNMEEKEHNCLNPSESIYDYLSSDYKRISLKKNNYICSVNDLIYKAAPKNIKYYLDAGGGDGLRTEEIASVLAPDYTFLIDSSSKMINLAKKRSFDRVIKTEIIDFNSEIKFDLITSLWNVFGHIETREKRLKSIENLKNHLSPNGKMIFDVNNRYNITYGVLNVIKNLINDKILKSVSSGWYSFEYDKKRFPVYLHSPAEIINMLRTIGFTSYKIFCVDYKTGNLHKNYFFGQLLIVAKN